MSILINTPENSLSCLPALTGKLYPFMDTLLREAHQDSEDSSVCNAETASSQDTLSHMDTTYLKRCHNQVNLVDKTHPWTIERTTFWLQRMKKPKFLRSLKMPLLFSDKKNPF